MTTSTGTQALFGPEADSSQKETSGYVTDDAETKDSDQEVNLNVLALCAVIVALVAVTVSIYLCTKLQRLRQEKRASDARLAEMQQPASNTVSVKANEGEAVINIECLDTNQQPSAAGTDNAEVY